MTPLERALAYPYGRPTGAILYLNGRTIELDEFCSSPLAQLTNKLELKELLDPEERNLLPEQWVPLVSFGSNRSPDRLVQKFPVGVPIISLPAQLHGFDVVRSAHFSAYATLPATLITAPSTTVEVSLQWLPEEQLEPMHRSESVGRNYLFAQLPKGQLKLNDGSSLAAWTYQGIHGPLYWKGSPVAFSSIPAKGRLLPELAQEPLLRTLHRHWSTELSFEEWLLRLAEDSEYRAGAIFRLKQLGA